MQIPMHRFTMTLTEPSAQEGAISGATPERADAGPLHVHSQAHSQARPDARRFALADKLRIVREASQSGVKLAHIERKYGLGKNVLAYWRKAYRDLSDSQIRAEQQVCPTSDELAALRVQVRQLERLLGQKTLEVDLLKRRLEGDA